MSSPISRRFATLLALGTLVLGLVGGGVAGAYFAADAIGRVFGQSSLDLRGAEVRHHVLLLNFLRSGQSDKAIHHLEYTLDGDLLSYGFLSNKIGVLPPTAKAGILAAKKYRAQFPQPPESPEVSEAIRKVLDSVVVEQEQRQSAPSPSRP
jgi:hypothetical protein